MASKQSSSLQGDKETLDECKCPICMYILIEPVTLPCAHELCMPCYKKNVEEGSFTCPLCRTRISNWARKATKNNTLLDQKRWEQVKKLFPEKVQRRLDGLDDVTDEDDMNDNEEIDLQYRRIVQLSKPGEIREEYEAEVKRLDHGAEEERRREEEASVALIQELVTEDNQHIQKNQHLQQKIARQDEKLAQAESTSLVLTLMWCFLPHQNPQR
ncbi:E3 ubiquitin-protein ligase rnf168-like isoform X2 [Pomacea canaliculata]|nr:E3 ubiquitin-protein ligase rnf168-like isoform X2 [Pomacea canaliculata]